LFVRPKHKDAQLAAQFAEGSSEASEKLEPLLLDKYLE